MSAEPKITETPPADPAVAGAVSAAKPVPSAASTPSAGSPPGGAAPAAKGLVGKLKAVLAPLLATLLARFKKKKKDPHAPAGAPASAHAPAPAAKKSVGAGMGAVVKEYVSDLFAATVSDDPPSRWMARLFFVACFSLVGVSWGVWQRLSVHRAQGQRQEAVKMARHQREKDKKDFKKHPALSLGHFLIPLVFPDGRKPATRSAQTADIEVVVECDSGETDEYLDTNLVQARDEINSVLTAQSPEDLLSKEGKDHLKALIADKLNNWLPNGKVTKVIFPDILAG